MGNPAFSYLDEHLEFLFVQHLARRTLVSGVILRFLLLVAWASSWRKASKYFPDSSSSRCDPLMSGGLVIELACAVSFNAQTLRCQELLRVC